MQYEATTSRHSSVSSMSSSAMSSAFSRLTSLDDSNESLYGGTSSSTSLSSPLTTPSEPRSPYYSPDGLAPSSATLTFAADILAAEALALHAATSRLRNDKETMAAFDNALRVALRSISEEGKLVWCGVGKSGLIARKLCASALSLGIASVFLHPTEALHGDLGIVHSKDTVLLLSYSGESSEITELLPHIINRGTAIIAFCGKPGSSLVQISQAWVDCRMPSVPIEHQDPRLPPTPTQTQGEAWAEIPAPSSTTTLTLAMGDALIFTLARELGKGKRDFALNHPNGALGKAMREEGLATCSLAKPST